MLFLQGIDLRTPHIRAQLADEFFELWGRPDAPESCRLVLCRFLCACLAMLATFQPGDLSREYECTQGPCYADYHRLHCMQRVCLCAATLTRAALEQRIKGRRSYEKTTVNKRAAKAAKVGKGCRGSGEGSTMMHATCSGYRRRRSLMPSWPSSNHGTGLSSRERRWPLLTWLRPEWKCICQGCLLRRCGHTCADAAVLRLVHITT